MQASAKIEEGIHLKRKVLFFVGLLSISLLIGATATVALYEVPSVPGIGQVTPRPGGVTEIGVVPAPAIGGISTATIGAAAIPAITANHQPGGTVVFDVASPPFGTVETLIPANILVAATGMAVRVQTTSAAVELPASLVASSAAAGRTLSVTISTPAPQALDAARPSGTVRVGSPISVQTNFTGEMRVTIPLGLFLPTEPQARAAFLARLQVFGLVGGVGSTQSGLSFTIDETAVPPVLRGVTFSTRNPGSFSVIR